MTSIPSHQYQVLADLVQGEFQQLETKEDEGQVSFFVYFFPVSGFFLSPAIFSIFDTDTPLNMLFPGKI